MSKKNYKKIVWSYDTSDWDRKEMKEVYHEIYDKYPKDDYELENFIESENILHLEDEEANIKYWEKRHGIKNYVIKKDIQLWDGYSTFYNVANGLWNAIRICLNGYTENSEIYSFGGILHVIVPHHDGINHFIIKELKEEGDKYYKKHENDRLGEFKAFENLFSNRHYSVNVKLFKEMYGW